jgi:hypothetical protein
VADAIAQAAVSLQSSDIVIGESANFSSAQMAHLLGAAWDRIRKPANVRSRLVAYKLTGEVDTFLLGPHAPTLSEDDLELIHRLWLDAVGKFGLEVHHRDVVRAALDEFARDMTSDQRQHALERVGRQVGRTAAEEPAGAPAGAPTGRT